MTLEQVISVVDTLLEKVRWQRYAGNIPMGGEDARGFYGTVDGWLFSAYDYRGPFDDRCYDGAAHHRGQGLVYHLTPEQARKAVLLALAQIGGN